MNIHVSPHVPPAGSTSAGDLYVDLQSRTMWLGVDTAVDPDGAVLLSDIIATDAAIAEVEAYAKSYTDSQVATRALTVHTHTASQITDFEAAVEAIHDDSGTGFATGMIIMYSGSLANIGVGPLVGWALCNGSNGTPDLRDRFVLGAGNRAVGIANGATNFNTVAGGDHVHTINGTAITIAQMPAHDHTPGTGGESVDHAHYVSGVTDAQGVHSHSLAIWGGTSGRTDGAGGNGVPSVATYAGTEPAGNHQHNVNFWSGGRSAGHTHAIYGQGGNAAHSHTMVGGSLHQHNITGLQMREALPYLTLAYIMKL